MYIYTYRYLTVDLYRRVKAMVTWEMGVETETEGGIGTNREACKRDHEIDALKKSTSGEMGWTWEGFRQGGYGPSNTHDVRGAGWKVCRRQSRIPRYRTGRSGTGTWFEQQGGGTLKKRRVKNGGKQKKAGENMQPNFAWISDAKKNVIHSTKCKKKCIRIILSPPRLATPRYIH